MNAIKTQGGGMKVNRNARKVIETQGELYVSTKVGRKWNKQRESTIG